MGYIYIIFIYIIIRVYLIMWILGSKYTSKSGLKEIPYVSLLYGIQSKNEIYYINEYCMTITHVHKLMLITINLFIIVLIQLFITIIQN